jgi:Zn-dependent alcohol dehydrogenase
VGLCSRASTAKGAGYLGGGGRRWVDADGAEPAHHLGVSAFSEYTVVSVDSAVRVDDDLPFETAALFGCAVLTGVGAALRSAQVRPGQSVAVFGLGGVGLSALLGARVSGAGRIVAVELSGRREGV